MNALTSFIIPLAAIFFDLYMYVVLPGMATWSQVSGSQELWFSFYNPFKQVERQFKMPSIVEDIVGLLDRLGLTNAIPDLADLNMFGLFIVIVGLMFFSIMTIKAIRSVFID